MALKAVFFLILASLSLEATSLAQNACPDWLKQKAKDLPVCPEGGLVPETFPVGALVISDKGQDLKKDSGFTVEVIKKVLMASGEQNPLLLLPVSDETIARVKAGIDGLPVSAKLKKQYKRAIVQVPISPYPWQQDYMQPTVDPKTGQVLLRGVQDYQEGKSGFKQLAQAAEACGFKTGPPLVSENYVSGNLGGNIETLPAGLCVIGSDNFVSDQEWGAYADQVCNPDSESRIKVPTSWLQVGHTDEVMRVVRNKKAKAPCDFSIAIASPRKAIELLKDNKSEPFLDFSNHREGSAKELLLSRSRASAGLRELCEKKFLLPKTPAGKKPKSGKGITEWLLDSKIFVTEAQAGVDTELTAVPPEFCVDLTNEDVYRVVTGEHELKTFNQLVQDQMDSLKDEIRRKLKNRLPQCEPDFIEMPGLFYGGTPVRIKKGVYELPKGYGLSILPNPTNSLSVGDTVISPDPSNRAFKKYMQDEYQKKRKLRAEFVDTFDYGHLGKGNLHCVTNTVHLCSPRSSK